MALPFLPEADIGRMFKRLSHQATTAQLQAIMQYKNMDPQHPMVNSLMEYFQSFCLYQGG
ncbi:hypothetical protein E2C01_100741 [Portunus trituberculatus]|uniref:Uncharacterized protein n=1 Tax=Portunus trituberculatus TaxID=210409 RepID=A0A5B7K3X3_PORTR|nr:hypothetical protein [Portunus trituberculatus]